VTKTDAPQAMLLPRPTPRSDGGPPPAGRQLAVTVTAPVAADRLTSLRRTLAAMAQDPAGNTLLPLGALPGAHFARLFVLDTTADTTGAPVDARLLYMADVDTAEGPDPLGRHLTQLVGRAGDGLDRVFGACRSYPAGRPSRQERLAWLRRHTVDAVASYVNTVGRTVDQILAEARLHEAIVAFVDGAGRDWSGLDAGTMRATIQAFVRSRPELSWALRPAPSPTLDQRLVDAVDFVGRGVGGTIAAGALAPVLPAATLALRAKERTDPAPHLRPDPRHVAALAALEDHHAQNPFSAVGFIKPGLLRRLVTEGVTRTIDYTARHVFNRGDLAGVTTIHTARWVFLDEHRRLIFTSNYDGSLESYNDDFINLVAWGLNAVFSNGVGYPRTSWLVFGGASREQEFKDYLRRHQVPTQIWFSAYPELTAGNIDNNARLRQGLFGELDEQEVARWLRRI
jgi:hypothetical protein